VDIKRRLIIVGLLPVCTLLLESFLFLSEFVKRAPGQSVHCYFVAGDLGLESGRQRG